MHDRYRPFIRKPLERPGIIKTIHISNHMQLGPHHFIESTTCAFAAIGASLVAITQSRFDPDIVAVIGALFASVISVIEARERNRTLTHTISVFIASAGVGSVVPGTIVWTWFPERVATLSWHTWAVMGGIAGLLGWSLTAAVLALRSRVPGLVNTAADKYLPPDHGDRVHRDGES